MKDHAFGVDLGGTTCKLGLFRTDGTLLEKWEIPTDRSENGSRILSDIAAAIRKKMDETGLTAERVRGIGIGVPGAVTPDGMVNRCINLGWGIVPVEEELSELTGLPVRAANDANIAALGEYWMGSGRGFDSIVMVTLGTGIGGGIILGGHIVAGHDGAGGEIGHIVVNPGELERCSCGNCGCIEQYASATGIVRRAKHYLASGTKASLLRGIEPLTARDVVEAAKQGDDLAGDVTEEVCTLLGRAIATICNVVNPEAVLIGGGVSRAGQILLDELRDGFDRSIFHAARNTKIVLASLGNDAGIYGGVRLVLEE